MNLEILSFLSVSARLGFTGLISGSVLVFLPLLLIGFHPLLVMLTLAASLFYQVFLHTELVGKLGPLEWLLNTPSHHRVHHGSNRQYSNKNYGGVLGRVDLSWLNFVRIKCIVIVALVIRTVILRKEQVTMRKMHLNESKGQHLSCFSTALSLIYVE